MSGDTPDCEAKKKRSPGKGIKIDARFLYQDTGLRPFRPNDVHMGLAFSPMPLVDSVKSKAAWLGIVPRDEVVARALAKYFSDIAEYYEREKTKSS